MALARGLCGRLLGQGAGGWPGACAPTLSEGLQGWLGSPNSVRGAKTETKAEKKAKAKMKDESDNTSIGSKAQTLLKTLEPQEVPKLKMTPEEKEEYKQRAKEYSRIKMAEERAWQKSLSVKLQLKLAAIEALPSGLKEHASTPDYEPFPTNRWIATDTPPIKGYYESKSGVSDRSKRRR
mmetsp:Transcript_9814/g.24955  ORF Transcript_9814/g.24955 Transcript_9814/m.24955 type:complete len:180 (+) Transcript_9814:224-763(+)|eukprot:jgi/Tetstr1/426836/TSEL_017051.t1